MSPIKKKVLIISYFFPPYNTIGALRVGKFAKYLSNYGWEPYILTLEKGILNISEDLIIESDINNIIRADWGKYLTSKINQEKISKEKSNIPNDNNSKKSFKNRVTLFLYSLFSDSRLPDRALPWLFPALNKGNNLMKNIEFDALLSSHGPPTVNIVASILSKKHNVPWVADFRDLWTQNHFMQNRCRFVQWIEEAIELKVLRRCNTMVTVSLPLKTQLENFHQKKVVIIPNGFDPEDYSIGSNKNKKCKKLKIVYTGMIYEGKQDPSILFEAINELIIAQIISRDDIQVDFYGTDPKYINKLTSKYNLEDIIFTIPRIPHNEIIKKQLEADILLLIDFNDPNVTGFYSGKVFEYLGAGKPIFAIGPKGNVIDLLLIETHSGFIVNMVSEAMVYIKNWVNEKNNTGEILHVTNLIKISKYSRTAQAKEMAKALNSCITEINELD